MEGKHLTQLTWPGLFVDIHWIANYTVDSIFYLSNNLGPKKFPDWTNLDGTPYPCCVLKKLKEFKTGLKNANPSSNASSHVNTMHFMNRKIFKTQKAILANWLHVKMKWMHNSPPHPRQDMLGPRNQSAAPYSLGYCTKNPWVRTQKN